jgi:hypothetical protein
MHARAVSCNICTCWSTSTGAVTLMTAHNGVPLCSRASSGYNGDAQLTSSYMSQQPMLNHGPHPHQPSPQYMHGPAGYRQQHSYTHHAYHPAQHDLHHASDQSGWQHDGQCSCAPNPSSQLPTRRYLPENSDDGDISPPAPPAPYPCPQYVQYCPHASLDRPHASLDCQHGSRDRPHASRDCFKEPDPEVALTSQTPRLKQPLLHLGPIEADQASSTESRLLGSPNGATVQRHSHDQVSAAQPSHSAATEHEEW